MAGNQAEINRLHEQITELKQQIQNLKQQYRRQTNEEIERIKTEMLESMAAQQTDLRQRFLTLEKSISDAYAANAERFRKESQLLEKQTIQLREQLQKRLSEIQKEQSEFLQTQQANDRAAEKTARDNLFRFDMAVDEAHLLPVEQFYPHALERYIAAGDEARRLLNDGLYSLAAAKADVAFMAVDKLTFDTREKMEDLERMFILYREKLEMIQKAFNDQSNWTMYDENGTIILELNQNDADYWSDQLYGQLQESLQKHQQNIDGGVEKWLKQCSNSAVPPILLLDREIQFLDSIPRKFQICISYALSACDCFNYSQEILTRVRNLLAEQNYDAQKLAYGACKVGNNSSVGYQFYYDNWLKNQSCLQTDGMPDFREERCEQFISVTGIECVVTMVPRRQNEVVSVEMFITLKGATLPEQPEELLGFLRLNGLSQLQLRDQREQTTTAIDRPMNLEAVEHFVADPGKSLEAKYSYSTGNNK